MEFAYPHMKAPRKGSCPIPVVNNGTFKFKSNANEWYTFRPYGDFGGNMGRKLSHGGIYCKLVMAKMIVCQFAEIWRQDACSCVG